MLIQVAMFSLVFFQDNCFTNRAVLGGSFWGNVLPHITTPGNGFKTSIFFDNPYNISNTFFFVSYDSDGKFLGYHTDRREFQPNESRIYTSEYFREIFPNTAYLDFLNDTLAAYEFEGLEANKTLHTTTNKVASIFRLVAGNPDTEHDSIALVNADQGPVKVLIRQFSQDGTLLGTRTLAESLGIRAQLKTILSGPNTLLFSKSANCIFEIEADGLLSMMAFRTYRQSNGAFLFSNPTAVRQDAFLRDDIKPLFNSLQISQNPIPLGGTIELQIQPLHASEFRIEYFIQGDDFPSGELPPFALFDENYVLHVQIPNINYDVLIRVFLRGAVRGLPETSAELYIRVDPNLPPNKGKSELKKSLRLVPNAYSQWEKNGIVIKRAAPKPEDYEKAMPPYSEKIAPELAHD